MTDLLAFPSHASSFRKEGLAWVFEPTAGGKPSGLRFRVERIQDKGDALWGLVTVTTGNPGLRREVLGPIRHNFLAARSGLVGELTRSYDEALMPSKDWREALELLTRHLLGATRDRAQVEDLGEQELPAESPDLVERLIEVGQSSVLFGPGGAGKGWISIALALCVKEGLDFCGLQVRQAETAYLDGEADRETFIRRVKAVGKGLGIERPSLTRIGMVGAGPLSANLEQIARLVAERKTGLLIHDSVGRLSVQIGQHGTYEDAAKEFTDALAALGPDLSHFLLDHISSEGNDKRLAGRPMNSIRKHYDVRRSWEIRGTQEGESSWLVAGLYHQKHNNTRQFAPLGLRLSFDSDAYGRATCVRFSRADVRDEPGLLERLSQPEQVLALLRQGKMTTKEIAEALDASQSAVRVILGRLQLKRNIVALDDSRGGRGNVQTWGLAAEAESATRLSKSSVAVSISGGLGAPPEIEQHPKGNKEQHVAVSRNGRFPGDQDEDPEPWPTDAPDNGEVVFE